MSVKAKLTASADSETPKEPARSETRARKTYLPRIYDSLRSRFAKKVSLVAVAVGGFVAVGHFLGGLIGWWHAYDLTFRGHATPTSAALTKTAPLRSVLIVPFSAPPTDPALQAAAKELSVAVTEALGKSMREWWVASARTADAYGGKVIDAKAVGLEANVRFLLEGDVAPVGDQVAFTLRLIDTRDGRQLDSARRVFERAQLADPTALTPVLTSAARVLVAGEIDRNRAVAKQGSAPTSAQDFVDLAESLSIADRVVRAREQRRLADAAIKLDPKLARAWVIRADASIELFWNDLLSDPGPMVADADADSARAVALDDKDPMAWVARGNALRMRGNMTAAATAFDRAQEVDPTRFSVQMVRGFFYLDIGRPQDALKNVAKLRPILGAQHWGLAFQACVAHLQLASYEAAVPECERAGTTADDWNALARLTAAYAMSGQLENAAQTKARLLKVMPGFTIARLEERHYPRLAPEVVALSRAHFVAGLRKAGVPEGR